MAQINVKNREALWLQYASHKDLPDHLQSCLHRIVQCKQCKASIKYQDHEAHLRDTCPAVEVACQHNGGCGQTVRRDAMTTHIDTECSRTLVACPVPGCQQQIPRDDMKLHLDNSLVQHVMSLSLALQQANSKIAAQEATAQEADREIAALKARVTELEKGGGGLSSSQIGCKALTAITQPMPVSSNPTIRPGGPSGAGGRPAGVGGLAVPAAAAVAVVPVVRNMTTGTITMVVAEGTTYHYVDPKGEVHGPYSPAQMHQWHLQLFFSEELPISCSKTGTEKFLPLSHWVSQAIAAGSPRTSASPTGRSPSSKNAPATNVGPAPATNANPNANAMNPNPQHSKRRGASARAPRRPRHLSIPIIAIRGGSGSLRRACGIKTVFGLAIRPTNTRSAGG
eukprot:jgi/Mesvir1/12297/Mv00499-RA.1